MKTITTALFTSLATLTSLGLAVADDVPTAPVDTDGGTDTPGKVAPPSDGYLPPPQSDNDVQPEVASPGMPTGGLVSQAGVGGLIGYGRAGVLELGGSLGLTFASDYRNINVAPTIGWFVADNFELSALVTVSNIKANDTSATLWSALLEPSYHIPVNRSMFGFLGLGMGASHVSGIGTGFALAPRLGANFMVGRSGVLTPSLSYQYTTIDTDTSSGVGDATVVALTSAVRINIGYTVMW